MTTPGSPSCGDPTAPSPERPFRRSSATHARPWGRLHHPAATHPLPILAATVPQAIVDLAWDQLGGGRPHLDRHTIARWTGTDDEDPALCRFAL